MVKGGVACLDLVVCEKPSAAKDFAAALGAKWDDKNQRYTSATLDIVMLRGHVLALKGLRDIDSRFAEKWHRDMLSQLPIIPNFDDPEMMVWNIEKSKQTMLQQALTSSKYQRIINACDPGREGELLFWEVYHAVGAEKPVFRFWESEALSRSVVLRGLSQLKPESFYAIRKKAAFARQRADWILGMNLTVAYSVSAGTFYSVGPVQTPTLAMVVQRDELIEQFVTLPYCEIVIGFDGYDAKYCPDPPKWPEKKYSLAEEDTPTHVEYFAQAQTATVQSLERKRRSVLPPKLYSLTTLQIAANRRLGFSASSTLKIAQKLYEEYKCLSYPRTDSEVIGSSMTHEVHRIAQTLSDVYAVPYTGCLFTKRNQDDGQLTDHHALLPLSPLPSQATDSERQIYELILHRFFEAFAPVGIDETMVVTFDVLGHTYESRGRQVLDAGWRVLAKHFQSPMEELDDNKKEEGEILEPSAPKLFQLVERQIVRVKEAAHSEHKTLDAPKHYTEADLLNAMKNIANSIPLPELRKKMKDVGGRLGTPATQDSIIELLIKRGYLERKKKLLLSTPLGRALIHTVDSDLSNAIQRAQMEDLLNRFDDPKASDQYLFDVQQMVCKHLEHCRTFRPDVQHYAITGLQCPNCQSEILDKHKYWGCRACNFTLPKIWGQRTLDESDLKDLCTGRSTAIHAFKSKEGKTFRAKLQLLDNKLAYQFPETEELSLGACPHCQAAVVPRGDTRLACTQCGFTLWRTIAGKKLSDSQLKKLLKERQIPQVKGFKKKDGTTFAAGLKLADSGTISFTR